MKADTVIVAVLIALLAFGMFACERAKWRECRRYHPLWYCLDEAGSR